MKKYLVVLLCLLMSFSLFAQGGSEKDSQGPVTLELLLSDDTLEGGAMADAVARFNEEYKDKGIQVKINEIAYADIKTQIQNRASVNELPALVKTSEFNAYADYAYVLEGLSQDDFVLDGTDSEGFKATTVNTTAVGMVINKTAFDQAGVAYPTSEAERWTWDEFVEAVNTVVEKTDLEYGLVIDHSQQRINTILYHFGYQEYDPEDNKHITYKETAGKGIEFILSLYEDGVSPVSVGIGAENAQNTFKTGKVAAHFAGSWVVKDYLENISSFEWVPVLMPYADEKATCPGGNFLYAFNGTGVEKEANEFLKWFYKSENYSRYCAMGNYLPGMKGVDVDYEYDGLSVFNQELNASCAQVAYDKSIMNDHAGSSWGNATRDNLDKVIAGELSIDQMLDRVDAAIRDAYPDMH